MLRKKHPVEKGTKKGIDTVSGDNVILQKAAFLIKKSILIMCYAPLYKL